MQGVVIEASAPDVLLRLYSCYKQATQ
jgi:acyl-CoA-binding protein